MDNKATFNAILEDVVQLDNSEGEAFAALMQNPVVNWIRFTLTDDKPNGNKQRIPQEEFPNIIKSGIFMPVKKAKNKIEKGHNDATPLGVITHLKHVEDKIKGIAALWSNERPQDVEQIEAELKAGRPINLSWELKYKTAEASEDGGTTLRDVVLTAATIVGLPAYKGRTAVEAFASDEEQERKEAMAEETEKDLEKAKLKIEELKLTIEDLKGKLSETQKMSVEKDTELVGLKSYKAEVEKVEADRKKLGDIKTKFTSAKIVKDDKYFEENKDKLLALDENTLEFMLQDLVVFKTPEDKKDDKVEDKTKIPDIKGPTPIPDLSPSKLGEALRDSLKPQPKATPGK